jgi:hypothetical protein
LVWHCQPLFLAGSKLGSLLVEVMLQTVLGLGNCRCGIWAVTVVEHHWLVFVMQFAQLTVLAVQLQGTLWLLEQTNVRAPATNVN